MKRFIKKIPTRDEQILEVIILDEELSFFTVEMLVKIAKNRIKNVQQTVERLCKREPAKIYRLEKGKYIVRNFRNEHVIGSFLANGGTIAYWTALNLHGLTVQFPNIIFVQSDKQKQDKNIFGVDYKFVTVKPEKIIGIEQQGYGNNSFRITDKEKTIVDCFDLPRYSGGYNELIQAYLTTDLDEKKMIAYCKAINNIAATKRMGFLSENYRNKNLREFEAYALSTVNRKYDLLDPSDTKSGKYHSKWKLILNIENDRLEKLVQ